MTTLLAAVEELLRRQEAAERLLPFIQFTKHGYKVALHHRLICDALERIERAIMERQDARLLVRMPPRGGKSEIVSRKFPAWLLGRHPELQVIATRCVVAVSIHAPRVGRDEFRRQTGLL